MDRLRQAVTSLSAHNDSLWQITPRGNASSWNSNQVATACEAMATVTTLDLTLPRTPNEIAHPALNQVINMIARRDAVEATVTSMDVSLAFQEWKSKVFAYNSEGEANVQLSGVSSGRQLARYIKGHGKFRQDLDVIVEWKRYGPIRGADSLAIDRTDRMARLLSTTIAGRYPHIEMRGIFPQPGSPLLRHPVPAARVASRQGQRGRSADLGK